MTGGLRSFFGSRGDEAFVEEPGEVVEKPRSRAGWIFRNVALIVVATVVTVAGLRSRGISVSILLIVAAFVALRLLMLAVSEVAPPVPPRRSASRGADSSGSRLARHRHPARRGAPLGAATGLVAERRGEVLA
nr:hypothetical protein GCM10020092_097690 [Actinoplanes digitatis]